MVVVAIVRRGVEAAHSEPRPEQYESQRRHWKIATVIISTISFLSFFSNLHLSRSPSVNYVT